MPTETETLIQSETEAVPKQQSTWSDSVSLVPPAVPAQEPILALAMEQQQPEPRPEMEVAEAEEQLPADPPGGNQEDVPQLRRSTRVRRPPVKLKEGGM